LVVLVVALRDVGATDHNLAPRVGLVGDPVVALHPVDQLDLDSRQGSADATRSQLVPIHDGSGGGDLGQAVALQNFDVEAGLDELVRFGAQRSATDRHQSEIAANDLLDFAAN